MRKIVEEGFVGLGRGERGGGAGSSRRANQQQPRILRTPFVPFLAVSMAAQLPLDRKCVPLAGSGDPSAALFCWSWRRQQNIGRGRCLLFLCMTPAKPRWLPLFLPLHAAQLRRLDSLLLSGFAGLTDVLRLVLLPFSGESRVDEPKALTVRPVPHLIHSQLDVQTSSLNKSKISINIPPFRSLWEILIGTMVAWASQTFSIRH